VSDGVKKRKSNRRAFIKREWKTLFLFVLLAGNYYYERMVKLEWVQLALLIRVKKKSALLIHIL
jgi:hypothetical protein